MSRSQTSVDTIKEIVQRTLKYTKFITINKEFSILYNPFLSGFTWTYSLTLGKSYVYEYIEVFRNYLGFLSLLK